jgi:tRNA(fMet)-specific endonuclease VapC
MAGRILLDTNIVIAHLDQDESVNEHISHTTEVFVSAVVVGELSYGTMKSQRKKSNIARLMAFLRKATTLACDATTAHIYGEIKNELRLLGKPIPDNDIWIAANVRQYGLTLASRDDHFSHVPNLKVEKW